MAFADQPNLRERSAGIAGVAIVHAGLAALIVVGLSTEVTREVFSGPLPTREFKDPPPPPPEDPMPQPRSEEKAPPIYVPPLPTPLLPKPSFIDTTTELPPMSDEVKLTGLPSLGDIDPPTVAGMEPVAASPRNSPANWVTDSDYRSRWIREGMYGTASFRLDVAANGKVSACRITRSTGHAALDEATCQLITRRAKFTPATDASGAVTAGSYSSSIRWVLPD